MKVILEVLALITLTSCNSTLEQRVYQLERKEAYRDQFPKLQLQCEEMIKLKKTLLTVESGGVCDKYSIYQSEDTVDLFCDTGCFGQWNLKIIKGEIENTKIRLYDLGLR